MSLLPHAFLVTMKNEENDQGMLAVLALALTRTSEGVLAFLNASCHEFSFQNNPLSHVRLRKQQPLMLKITRDTVAWHGPMDMPEACWQKGSTTTMVCVPCLT